MTPPKPFSLRDMNANKGFVTSNEQNEALIKATGKNIHELVAEAVEHERQRMLVDNRPADYIKLLTTLFGKFAIGAPTRIESSSPADYMTKEDLEERRANLITRLALEAAASNHTKEHNEKE